MAQLSYTRNRAKSMLGMKANSMYDFVEGGWVAQEVIPIGRAVVKMVGKDDGLKLPNVTDQEFRGVALHDYSLIADSLGIVSYDQYEPVNVLVDGQVWVWCETAINPDTDSVFVRHVVGGANELVGQFRNDNAGGNAIAATGFKFHGTISAAGLILVKVNLKP